MRRSPPRNTVMPTIDTMPPTQAKTPPEVSMTRPAKIPPPRVVAIVGRAERPDESAAASATASRCRPFTWSNASRVGSRPAESSSRTSRRRRSRVAAWVMAASSEMRGPIACVVADAGISAEARRRLGIPVGTRTSGRSTTRTARHVVPPTIRSDRHPRLPVATSPASTAGMSDAAVWPPRHRHPNHQEPRPRGP